MQLFLVPLLCKKKDSLIANPLKTVFVREKKENAIRIEEDEEKKMNSKELYIYFFIVVVRLRKDMTKIPIHANGAYIDAHNSQQQQQQQ